MQAGKKKKATLKKLQAVVGPANDRHLMKVKAPAH